MTIGEKLGVVKVAVERVMGDQRLLPGAGGRDGPSQQCSSSRLCRGHDSHSGHVSHGRRGQVSGRGAGGRDGGGGINTSQGRDGVRSRNLARYSLNKARGSSAVATVYDL